MEVEMRKQWPWALALAPIVWLAATSSANAQLLGPASVADIVDVEINIASATCANVGAKFDTRLNPDGTQTPFDIPAGRVLVVTSIDILGFGATPGEGVQTRIFRGVGLTVNVPAIRESTADASGRIFHIYEFDPGLVVASGGEVCTNNNLNITTTGMLHGYLATP
jgi:hypothetical protein